MLEAAIGLSTLIQGPNVVTWNESENLKNYIRRLQAAVQRLAALNQQLTQCNEQIQDTVTINDWKFNYEKQLMPLFSSIDLQVV